MRDQSIYKDRESRFKLVHTQLEKKYNYYSIVRLVSFFVGIGIIILAFNLAWYFGLASVFLFILLFGYFMIWHERLKTNARNAAIMSEINGAEIQYLNFDYSAFFNGEEFLDLNHPFAADLDIFGPNSLYQSLCRSESLMGRKRLADLLSEKHALGDIELNQEFNAALSDDIEWRQTFQLAGRGLNEKAADLELLRIWLADAYFIRNNNFLKFMRFVNILWFFGSIVLIWVANLPLAMLTIAILPAMILLGKTLKNVNDIHEKTAKSLKVLKKYGQMMKCIELAEFSSEKFNMLKSTLLSEEDSASASIRRLSYYLAQLDLRANVFTIFLNLAFLWDFHWVIALENWKFKNRHRLLDWFEAMAEIDALISFSTFTYNNPSFIYPKIRSREDIVMEGIGHPLIKPRIRVVNDLGLPSKAHIKLITGSNMSGKSTFLRTVGVNMVLAYAGSTVCATQFQIPMLSIYTSMRTKDALHEATSSFYAELKRLKFVLEGVKSDQQIFFLLDEILKGTNSEDRHLGSRSLIQQLINENGVGLIATHDLELSDMEKKSNGHVENLCFDVEVENGKLLFNYIIKKGVCSSFNATILMKEMGIDIPVHKLKLHA